MKSSIHSKSNKSFRFILHWIIIASILIIVILFIRKDLISKIPTMVYIVTESPSTQTQIISNIDPTTICFEIENIPVDGFWFTINAESSVDYKSVLFSIRDAQENILLNRFLEEKDLLSHDEHSVVISFTAQDLSLSELPVGNYYASFTNCSETMKYAYLELIPSNLMHRLNIGSIKYTYIGRTLAYILLFLSGTYLCILLFTKIGFSPQKFFTITAAFLGVIYLILCIAWSVPDTDSHYPAVYRYSNLLLGQKNEWGARKEDVDFYKSTGFYSRNSTIKDYLLVLNSLKASQNDEYFSFQPKEHMKFYSVFCYLPMVMGISLGRILNQNAFITHYLARVVSLVIYILLCRRAIHVTPIGKWIFTMTPLLPIPLIFASSFSYDMMVLSVSLNFLASVLRMNSNELDTDKTYFFESLIWTFLLGAVKGGGYLIFLPVIGIFSWKYSRYRFRNALIIVFTAFLSLFLFDLILPSGMKLFQFGSTDTTYLSASFAISHPNQYLMMVIKAYLVYLDFNIINLGGMNLAYSLPTSQPTLSVCIILVLIFLCFLAGLFEIDNISVKKQDQYICYIIITLAFLAIPAMLLSWTPIGSDVVEGLQGRYFLPCLPVIMLALSKYRFQFSIRGESADRIANTAHISKVFGILSIVNIYLYMRICFSL